MYICLVLAGTHFLPVEGVYSMNSKQFEKISKALGDPTRVSILQEIKRQQNCLYCTDIQDVVSLTQSSISHHVKLLSDADLIITQKEGRSMRYSLNQEMLNEYIGYLHDLRK